MDEWIRIGEVSWMTLDGSKYLVWNDELSGFRLLNENYVIPIDISMISNEMQKVVARHLTHLARERSVR